MAGSNFKPKTFPGFKASPLNKCTAMEHAQTFISTHSIQGVTHTRWDMFKLKFYSHSIIHHLKSLPYG